MPGKRNIAAPKGNGGSSRRPLCVYPLLGAAAVTLLLFTSAFFLPVRELEGEREQGEHSSSLMPITALASPVGNAVLENIYAWVDLKGGGCAATAQSPLRFSAYIGAPQPYPYTKYGEHQVKEQSYFASGMAATYSQAVQADTPLLAPLPWETRIAMPVPEEIPFTPPKGIFWLNEEGLAASNPPQLDTKQVLEILGEERQGVGSTRLEYRLREQSLHPRVVIRQSCGNPRLDEMAAGALRGHLYRFAKENQFTAHRAAGSGGSLTVLWHIL